MPQIQLPVVPAGSTEINSELAFECRDHEVTSFNGHLPVFRHAADDLASFRFFTAGLIVHGTATQREIVQAFGVPLTTVKRCTKNYRQSGGKGFFAPPPRRAGTKLNPERLRQAQQMLDAGLGVPEVSRQQGVLATTLHKAIASGRLVVRKKKTPRRSPWPGPAPKPSG